MIPKLFSVPGVSNAKGLGLAFQANDPYVTDFTLAILRLQENGFLENLKRKWWESSTGCAKEKDTGKDILDMNFPQQNFQSL